MTYADTRLTPGGEVPVERVLTNSSVYDSDAFKRQCLDFGRANSYTNTSARGWRIDPSLAYLKSLEVTSRRWSEASSLPQDYMLFFPQQGEDGRTGGPESLVPATCRVEKFLVNRAVDVGAPVTQLSDHYGVEGTATVIREWSSPAVSPAAPDAPRPLSPPSALEAAGPPEEAAGSPGRGPQELATGDASHPSDGWEAEEGRAGGALTEGGLTADADEETFFAPPEAEVDAGDEARLAEEQEDEEATAAAMAEVARCAAAIEAAEAEAAEAWAASAAAMAEAAAWQEGDVLR